MANFIQYGDKKLPMGEMTLDEAKDVMKRHFPELANMKVETKKEGDDTVHIVSKQAGQKGSLANAGDALLAIKPTPFFSPAAQRRIGRILSGEDAEVSLRTLEAWVDALDNEAGQVELVGRRIERIASAYPAAEVTLL